MTLGDIFQTRWWLAGVLSVLGATVADAQVYEITPQGAMMVRDGGGSVIWHTPQGQATAPTAPVSVGPPPPAMTQAVNQAAARHRISPQLLEALIWQESRWHTDAVSPKGARGLSQLMPGTARLLGVDARDPAANLEGGAHYLRLMLDRFGGDVELALAAYNAGPAKVERAHGIPAITETRNYVASVMNRLGGHALLSCVNIATCPSTLP